MQCFRRHPLPLALGALACALLTGCPPGNNLDAGPDNDPSGATWEVAFDLGDEVSLSGVWGSGPDDVFVVGGDQNGAKVFHFDGDAWAAMELPSAPLLAWAYGFGPDDVFAVGTSGAMLRYDGTSWSVIDTGTDQDLWGIFGFSNTDLWIVGGDVDGDAPLMLHYDGASVTEEPIDPADNPTAGTALFKVWGIGDALFAVGTRGLILKRTADAWVYSPPGQLANDDFVSLWGTSADHIVAVGGRSNARIATWDGQVWETIAPSGLGGLNAIWMDDVDEMVVGGVNGTAGLFDPREEDVIEEETGTRFDLHAIWGDGAGRHYAVGGSFIEPHRGVALVRTVQ